MAAPVADQAWLAWIGRLLEASSPARGEELPRSEFHCRLDDQPDHLVPATYRGPETWEGLADRPLFLNPGGRFARSHECASAFPEIRPQHLRQFALRGDIFWTRHSGHGGCTPFWLSPGLRSAVEEIHFGDGEGTSARAIPCGVLHALVRANVLVTENHATKQSEAWSRTAARAAEQFQKRGFAPIGDLIHPYHISALRRYYRWQIRNGRLRLGDQQSPLRYASHNENVACFFHHQLTRAVSMLAGEAVKPSYAYLGCYQPGALLKKHTDREQCEFSLSLCLDYSPEPVGATPWPLQLHTARGTVTVYQAPGDALLYRGREIPHSREHLPEGHTSTSIFFHYVRENFQGKLE